MKPLVNVLTFAKSDLMNFLIIFFCFLLGFMSMAFLSFGFFVKDFSTVRESFIVVFEISLPTYYDYSFLDQTSMFAPQMSMVFFLAITTMFLFFFTNIFLAIMMNSYQINIGQFKKYQSADKAKKPDEINLVKSFFYCIIQNDNADDEKKGSDIKNIVSKGEEKMIIGINQKLPKKQVPDYMKQDFDPHDPYSNYN